MAKLSSQEVALITADPMVCDEGRTGTLYRLTVGEISNRLGFAPNREDDIGRVTASWGFRVNGEPCAIWDYKGSARVGVFSTWGPREALRAVFGDHLGER